MLTGINITDRPTLDLIESEQLTEGSATAAGTARRLIVEGATARRSARVAQALAHATASVAGNPAPLPAAASEPVAPPSGATEPAHAQEAA